ncbi:hypothetical protein [Litoribacillus peritrichatus]|uniref:Uncharacterized protein n=1 Tax=Litoribacillus peritrichatus TaxID=718191 RepID=A0ABP7MXJ5_9GAMM
MNPKINYPVTLSKNLIQTSLCAGLLSLSFHGFAQTAEFLVIDGLITDDIPFSEANGVSDDGSTVVGMSATNEGTISAFRWKNGQAIDLGALPSVGPNSSGQGISGDGEVLVGRGRTVNEEGTPINAGWMWAENSGMLDLGRPATFASDASYDGNVIVGKASSDNSDAFRWTPGTGVQLLPVLRSVEPNSTNAANAVSGDGSVIVGKSGSYAVRWTLENDTFSLGDFKGEAFDVTSDGSVIVGSGSFNGSDEAFLNEAFRWTEQTGAVALGLLPGHSGYSRAKAISADGSVIVGTSADSQLNEIKAFIWDAENGMRDLQQVLETDFNLDLGGLTLTSANGVSADGKIIVGRAVDANDRPRGWWVNLDQEGVQPPSLSLTVEVKRFLFFFSYTKISWSGATDNVEVLKDGKVIRSGGQSGEFTQSGKGSTYQVCQVNSDYCSDSMVAR